MRRSPAVEAAVPACVEVLAIAASLWLLCLQCGARGGAMAMPTATAIAVLQGVGPGVLLAAAAAMLHFQFDAIGIWAPFAASAFPATRLLRWLILIGRDDWRP